MTSSDTDFVTLVLAAGQGTRMKSLLPKVLHPLCGRPMVAYPVEAALSAGSRRCVVVVGHGRAHVEEAMRTRFAGVETSLQPEQRGTGDAVRCGMELLEGVAGLVVILHGDCPLIRAEVVAALVARARETRAKLTMLTSTLPDPGAYGRILRDPAGRVTGIREHRDCSDEERKIREVNPAVYAVDAAFLRGALARLGANNAQGEIYLTDVVALAAAESPVATLDWDFAELGGINDRWELAQCEAALRRRILRAHAISGVTLRDPESTFVDADVRIDPEVVLEPNVVLRGRTIIGQGATIDTGSVLTDVSVSPRAVIKPYTVATRSAIGEAAQIGPFSHLRPDSEISAEAHVGNFVEIKKTKLGRRSKANHLAYLGDGEIGDDVNVGAGTIFCNYDGYQKHVTVLDDGSFIGSDSQLIAPVRVGKNAYVATGTTVTRDVPDEALAIARPKQENKEGYAPRLRARLRSLAEEAKRQQKKPGE
jgi:bifunctional UDP-N-acetylglucosamine pyrophosphorylase/glucosamine-1-phosphate N-acetyltransferase